jgi:hypothetical protein
MTNLFSLNVYVCAGWMVMSVPYDHTASIEASSSFLMPDRFCFLSGFWQKTKYISGFLPVKYRRGISDFVEGKRNLVIVYIGNLSHDLY